MKTALITGDVGFVGRHIRKALIDAGWNTVGIDIRRDGLDVRDFFRDESLHNSFQYDLVVHCAAIVGGRATIEGSPLSVAVDLSIDAELFGWAIKTKPGRVVYYSSSAAYPIHYQTLEAKTTLSEDFINLNRIGTPDLTYGWAKLTGEMLAKYARQAGVPITVLRPFSGTGPDQDLDYPVPSICERAKREEDPIEIWSDSVRDIVHIEDIVKMTLACVDNEIDGPLNICTGRATSFSEVARIAAKIVGYSPSVKILQDKPTGVAYRVGDPTLMSQVYIPKISLENILKEMCV